MKNYPLPVFFLIFFSLLFLPPNGNGAEVTGVTTTNTENSPSATNLAPIYRGHFYTYAFYPKTPEGKCPADTYDFYNKQEAFPVLIKLYNYFE